MQHPSRLKQASSCFATRFQPLGHGSFPEWRQAEGMRSQPTIQNGNKRLYLSSVLKVPSPRRSNIQRAQTCCGSTRPLMPQQSELDLRHSTPIRNKKPKPKQLPGRHRLTVSFDGAPARPAHPAHSAHQTANSLRFRQISKHRSTQFLLISCAVDSSHATVVSVIPASQVAPPPDHSFPLDLGSSRRVPTDLTAPHN